MSECIYVHFVSMYVWMYHTYVCMYVGMYMYAHTYMYVCIYRNKQQQNNRKQLFDEDLINNQ